MALPKLPPHREEPEEEEEELGASMTFFDHLGELRERLIKSLAAFSIAMMFCFIFSGTLKYYMLKPYNWGTGKERQPILNLKDRLVPTLDKTIQAIEEYFQREEETPAKGDESTPPVGEADSEPTTPVAGQDSSGRVGDKLAAHSMLEVFMVHIKLSIVGAIFLAFPILFYQAWKFVAPGLYKRERRFILPTVFSAWICFITGGLFAYFLVIPTAVYFFSGFSGPDIVNVWSVDKYFTNALHITLAFGVVFEEPVIISLLAIIGLVRYKHLKKWRPYIIVGMFVLGAVLTPPDPISQLMCAIPLMGLYEISAQCVRLFERARGHTDDDDEDDEPEAQGATA
jgi:sec-independent protein translocase protein TatC